MLYDDIDKDVLPQLREELPYREVRKCRSALTQLEAIL